jgi:cytochrome P450
METAPHPLLADVDLATDPVPDLYDRIDALVARGDRVVPVRYGGKPAWLILRYADLAAAFMDPALPASPSYERAAVAAFGRILLAMEGDEHRASRGLVFRAFAPAAIRAYAERLLVPLANGLIDGFAGSNEVDLASDYARKYTFRVVSGLIGIPDRDEEQVIAWLSAIKQSPWQPELALAAREQLTAFLIPIIDARRAEPRDDLTSQIVHAEVDGRQLDQEEILSFLRFLYSAGADSTMLTLTSTLWKTLGDPAIHARLRDNPRDRVAAVEEGLRQFSGPSLLPRFTEQAVTIGGVAIPAQSWLLYGLGPANRDPEAFTDPHSFQVDRDARRHLAFGRGPHLCIGHHLAREELKTSLALLLDRLPGLRLVDPEEPVITGTVFRGVRTLRVAFDEVLPARLPALA